MIYDGKDDPLLQVSSQEPSTSYNDHFYQTFRIGPLATNNIIFNVQHNYVILAHNLGFLSQIVSNLDKTFGIFSLATTNIIFYVQLDAIL